MPVDIIRAYIFNIDNEQWYIHINTRKHTHRRHLYIEYNSIFSCIYYIQYINEIFTIVTLNANNNLSCRIGANNKTNTVAYRFSSSCGYKLYSPIYFPHSENCTHMLCIMNVVGGVEVTEVDTL